MRKDRGDDAIGNHLLLVDLPDGPWIADVGFGDGSREPFPLREGPILSDGYEYGLARIDADWWRLTNHPRGGAPHFDFTLQPADPARLAFKCHELQTSPESGFVLNAVAQRHAGEEIRMLRTPPRPGREPDRQRRRLRRPAPPRVRPRPAGNRRSLATHRRAARGGLRPGGHLS